jgi:Tfp pilus assembly protein PilF
VAKAPPAIAGAVAPAPGPLTNAPVKPADDAAIRLVAEGNQKLKDGQVAEAEALFTSALAKNSTLTTARIGLAACAYSQNNLMAAKQSLKEILTADPNHAQALGLFGLIAWREGNTLAAEQALRKAVQNDNADAQLHNYLGIILHTQGKVEAAVASFRAATQLNPQLAEAFYNLAVALTQVKPPQIEAARKEYSTATRLGAARDPQLENLLAGK